MPIAEYNVARLRQPIDHPASAGFRDNLDRINALAERSPGFVWRLDDDCTDEANQDMHGDPLLTATLSVWTDLESLRHFVHRTVHGRFYRQRGVWFSAMEERHLVLWNVEAGDTPTLEEAQARLAHLRKHGDSNHAFGWPAEPAAVDAAMTGVINSEGGATRAAGGDMNG